MHLVENQPLAPFTTFGIGGPARWFVEAASEDDVAEAVDWAVGQGIRIFVLGGGSNLLVSDAGFDGLVLRIALRGITSAPAPEGPAHVLFQAAAGEPWEQCVERAIEANCGGIECLAGIPGTVGGTPVQNVGAYGQEVAASIERVRAFDIAERVFVEFTAAECSFDYRRSRFNSTDRGRYIVTRVDYRLTLGGPSTVKYPDLQRALADTPAPTIAQVADAVRQVRRAKGMLLIEGDPDCRSAGSFFKNPVVSEDQLRHVAAAAHQAPPRFPAGPGHAKLPAAWLIEKAGFSKGYTLGSAAISSRHTLALINRGGATAAEILALAEQITAAVEARFGIALEIEPVHVGMHKFSHT